MKHKLVTIIMINMLVILAMACGVSTNIAEPKPTVDTKGTIAAAVAATDAYQGNAKATIDAAVAATNAAIPPTSTPEPTVAPPTSAPTQAQVVAASPTAGQQAVQGPIALTEWQRTAFTLMNSGCKVGDAACYKGGHPADNSVTDMIMTSINPITVDPNWKNPYLVFWHKYNVEQPAYVNIGIGSQWKPLKSFQGQATGWIQSFIDLNKYKGKDILIQFTAPAFAPTKSWWKDAPMNDWYLNDIHIVPNYTP